MKQEPDQIDMMGENELRIELRRLIKENIDLRNRNTPSNKIKKYTLAEIRAMFEKSHEGLDLSMSRFRPWEYSDSLTESMYGAYEQVFEDLGEIN